MEVSGGSVRNYFPNYMEYIGVDWRPGPNVNVVCMAKDMQFDHQFDVVISASMLEHDPTWQESLTRMVQYLKPDGIFLLSWGAAKNHPHCLETSVDNKFHALKSGLVLNELEHLGIYVHEFHYEAKLPYVKKGDLKRHSGFGEVCLVGFWNAELAPKEVARHIDALIPEDVA